MTVLSESLRKDIFGIATRVSRGKGCYQHFLSSGWCSVAYPWTHSSPATHLPSEWWIIEMVGPGLIWLLGWLCAHVQVPFPYFFNQHKWALQCSLFFFKKNQDGGWGYGFPKWLPTSGHIPHVQVQQSSSIVFPSQITAKSIRTLRQSRRGRGGITLPDHIYYR